MKYTINELANSKGVSPLVREALLQMEAELDAIKQALAAPVQEPVACKTLCELCVKRGYNFCANAVKTTPIPTPPAAQRQWVGLTVDELITLEQKHMRHEDLSRAIEAKLRSKNG
jgi:hypothetical protein